MGPGEERWTWGGEVGLGPSQALYPSLCSDLEPSCLLLQGWEGQQTLDLILPKGLPMLAAGRAML